MAVVLTIFFGLFSAAFFLIIGLFIIVLAAKIFMGVWKISRKARRSRLGSFRNQINDGFRRDAVRVLAATAADSRPTVPWWNVPALWLQQHRDIRRQQAIKRLAAIERREIQMGNVNKK